MTLRCECEQRCKLVQNGWGKPHPTHICPACKTEYWIVEGKPTRDKPEDKGKTPSESKTWWDMHKTTWGI